jgi:hypothetical protein
MISVAGDRSVQNDRDRAHDLAEKGLDKIIEGEADKGRRMIEEAKKIEPKAVEQLADEIESDRAVVESFVGKDKEKSETRAKGREEAGSAAGKKSRM